ncbi:ABC transporter C member 13 [Kappamyces sp. JEL0680]|nr:ABC transporter C member 13 [Kappamyces sp. JEL0680]
MDKHDDAPPKTDVQVLHPNGNDGADTELAITYFNYPTVSWLTFLFLRGARKSLVQEDLPSMPMHMRASEFAHVLAPFWRGFRNDRAEKTEAVSAWTAQEPTTAHQRQTGLFAVLRSHFGAKTVLMVVYALLSVGCQLAIPTFIAQIIYIVTPGYPKDELLVSSGVAVAFIITGLEVLNVIFKQLSRQVSIELQVDIKTCLIGAVYEKSLRLSHESSVQFNQGTILNMVNVDTEKVVQVFRQGANLVSAPVQIAVSIVLLARLVGVAVAAGAGTLFVMLAVQFLAVPFFQKHQKAILAGGDKRLKLIREMLYGIKIIKFRALEEFFLKKVDEIRKLQLFHLKM